MQLQYAKSNLDNAGSLEHRRATITLNPTVAHVLSRDLYQRPIESMIREVLINAIDAHVEAGQTRPVDIHIPTIWDEVFYIRDYGNGIEHSKLMDIYLAYGDSTRRESNEAHGGLGLGTKSPLAYTSSFAVVSYVDGVKNDYLVYYDEDNLPCIDHRETSTTFEPNGLKVSLTTISSNDYVNFQKAAQLLLSRIPADKVNVVNNSVADLYIVYDDTKVIGSMKLKSGKGIAISMGYVTYEMDLTAVLDFVSNKKTTFNIGGEHFSAYNVISSLTINRQIEIVSFIGKYPVHPSREYINISPRAVKCLCEDIQASLNILFEDSETLDIEQDIFRYAILGKLPVWKEEIRIRGRYLYGESWQSTIRMPKQLNTYGEFIANISRVPQKIIACGLPGTQLTDFLGSGRAEFRFPEYWRIGKEALFIYENDSEDEFTSLISLISETYETYDLTAIIAKYFADKEINDRYNSQYKSQYNYTPAPRRVVKSMQDPKHNVLLLNAGNIGTHKVDWSSTQHNVGSLKALNTHIFWVPTLQGCLKDKNALEIVKYYNSYDMILPKKWKVIILGLPASKGTKAIENTFKPISELKAHIDNYLATDTHKRKQLINSVVYQVYKDMHLTDMQDYAAYGPVNWVLRLNKLAYKCAGVALLNTKDIENEPLYAKAKTIRQDISIKFPSLISTRYYYYQSEVKAEDIKKWIETLADLLNNKPTGAKAKNDPYYLSR